MMKILLLTFGISFMVILVAALIINFSKRRQRKSPHGLTGMCHRSGRVVCGSCGGQIKKEADDSNRDI
ncbi:MAG: hypothetical protein WGN25_02195 [Candidatus Electrothrix sp. GW3-4]|uniref:hypothetical protein n=1 Tax=Candidatus Electrothrix sp. GW3-4 TaxID=3126740 RepID=UPI0030D20080